MTRSTPLVAVALLGLAGASRADDDIARLTMGRVTNPGGSWVFEMLPVYDFTRVSAPDRDAFGGEAELEFAPTDAITLALAAEVESATRGSARLDHVKVEAGFRLLEDPAQLALTLELAPSLNGPEHEAVACVSLLRRFGPGLLRLDYEAALHLDLATGAVALEHQAELAGYWLFGLNGLAGLGVDFRSPGQLLAELSLGGRVSPNVFVAIIANRGLTPGAPDYEVGLQVHFYFGPFRTAGLE